jgi:hypothetical protein
MSLPRIRMRPLGVLVLIALLLGHTGCRADAVCRPGNDDLQCLGTHFQGMYQDSYDQFWSILHGREEEIHSCTDDRVVAQFLALASHTGNAEFDEFYSKTVEELAMSNMACLAGSWSTLSSQDQTTVAKVLRTPMFRTVRELSAAAQKAKIANAYPRFIDAVGWH